MSDAWVELPPRPETEPDRASANPYARIHSAMGRLLSAHPGIAPAFGALFVTVMFGEGALSRREREMVAAVAAAAQDCFY